MPSMSDFISALLYLPGQGFFEALHLHFLCLPLLLSTKFWTCTIPFEQYRFLGPPFAENRRTEKARPQIKMKMQPDTGPGSQFLLGMLVDVCRMSLTRINEPLLNAQW